jgi:hypothetical protein
MLSYACGVIAGVIRELHKHDLHLTMSEAPDSALSDAGFLPKAVRELSADGILINMAGEMRAPFWKQCSRWIFLRYGLTASNHTTRSTLTISLQRVN